MAISTVNLTVYPYGKGGRSISLPVGAAKHIYAGTLVSQLTTGSGLTAASTALSGRAIGVAAHEQDNSAGALGDLRCSVLTDQIFLFSNDSTNAFAETSPLGQIAYAVDDHTVGTKSVGDTLQRAGFFAGMEPDGKVRVLVCFQDFASAPADVGESNAFEGHGVRGASTANVNTASFTVAGVDGLTYVAGERILLKDQSTASQNGIYVVGTVSAGSAVITRALDMDASAEVLPGALVYVSEGTANGNAFYFLSSDATVTIGSSNLTFTKIPTLADLASTSASLGASLIGIQDSAGIITGATVEAALAEIAAIVTPITRIQLVTGTFASGLATITVGAGQSVTANTRAFPIMSAVITGSTNVGCPVHKFASNVVGGSGVGQVLFAITSSDGANSNVDVDAAGTFHALLVN